MSDLISRQDAINTALEFFVEFLGGAFHEDDQKILMKRMNELPSAEPKSEERMPESAQNAPNDELISKKAAIGVLHEYFDGMLDTDTVCPTVIYGLFECMPSAEPERKKGKWIDDGTELGCCCSECGATLDDYFCGALHEIRLSKMLKFCPNCGSYNGGEQE